MHRLFVSDPLEKATQFHIGEKFNRARAWYGAAKSQHVAAKAAAF
jgi:hypothetical protein